jgi:hypothetical protein
MARRTKKIKKSISKKNVIAKLEDEWKIFSGKSFKLTKPIKAGGEKSNFRFSLSLIVLMAVLEMSLFMLLLTLITAQTAQGDSSHSLSSAPVTNNAKKLIKPTSQKLADASLDYELTVPSQLGEWLYKTGDIKSPIDDKISDQYLQIYLPSKGKTSSRNFNEMATTILTIKKFATDEWKKIDKGCQKGDSLLCDAEGTKLDEKNGSVYTYTKISSCPAATSGNCALIDKIVDSFQLK